MLDKYKYTSEQAVNEINKILCEYDFLWTYCQTCEERKDAYLGISEAIVETIVEYAIAGNDEIVLEQKDFEEMWGKEDIEFYNMAFKDMQECRIKINNIIENLECRSKK